MTQLVWKQGDDRALQREGEGRVAIELAGIELRRDWKRRTGDLVGPLTFLLGWIGLCAFLLDKYAWYYLSLS